MEFTFLKYFGFLGFSIFLIAGGIVYQNLWILVIGFFLFTVLLVCKFVPNYHKINWALLFFIVLITFIVCLVIIAIHFVYLHHINQNHTLSGEFTVYHKYNFGEIMSHNGVRVWIYQNNLPKNVNIGDNFMGTIDTFYSPKNSFLNSLNVFLVAQKINNLSISNNFLTSITTNWHQHFSVQQWSFISFFTFNEKTSSLQGNWYEQLGKINVLQYVVICTVHFGFIRKIITKATKSQTNKSLFLNRIGFLTLLSICFVFWEITGHSYVIFRLISVLIIDFIISIFATKWRFKNINFELNVLSLSAICLISENFLVVTNFTFIFTYTLSFFIYLMPNFKTKRLNKFFYYFFLHIIGCSLCGLIISNYQYNIFSFLYCFAFHLFFIINFYICIISELFWWCPGILFFLNIWINLVLWVVNFIGTYCLLLITIPHTVSYIFLAIFIIILMGLPTIKSCYCKTINYKLFNKINAH